MKVGIKDFFFDLADDHVGDGGAESLQDLDEEVVCEGAGGLLAREDGVDGGADGGLDIEDDRFLSIAKKNGAACLGGQEGDGFDLDELDFHCGREGEGLLGGFGVAGEKLSGLPHVFLGEVASGSLFLRGQLADDFGWRAED